MVWIWSKSWLMPSRGKKADLMGTIQIILGGIALARELVKLLNERNDNRLETAEQLRLMRLSLRRIREQGKTDDLEKILDGLGLPDSGDMQNK